VVVGDSIDNQDGIGLLTTKAEDWAVVVGWTDN